MVPNLSVHFGHFLSHEISARLVNPSRQGSPFRQVWKTEEKGSDVNLASHLLIDGFRAKYDLAVVISNDGDLKEPVHFVRHELNAPVGVLNPHQTHNWALSPRSLPHGSFYKPIRRGALAASQFAPNLDRPERGLFQADRLVEQRLKALEPPEGGSASYIAEAIKVGMRRS